MKVSIVGGSPSDKLHPQSGELWVHGNQLDRHQDCRVTRVFEIHDDLSEHSEGYAQWLVDSGHPLVVGENFPIQGNKIEVYPFKRVNALMGLHLTSTPAYMMGYAILSGATEIGIYGVDMGVDDHEYFYQRPTMYAWIGYAIAKGIEVFIPEESPLFKDDYVEGTTAGKPDLEKPPFTQKEFANMANIHASQINDLHSQVDQLQAKIQAHDGARQAYERLSKVARAVASGQDIKDLNSSAVIK